MRHTTTRFPALSSVLSTVVLFMATSSDAKPPEVFTSLDFEDAKTMSVEERCWLIVKGTAVWCGPCKKMDRTTWVDDEVITWVREHGLAIQVDVDRARDTARSLRITAMPTMIAFKDGEEFDRVVGYQGPEKFLSWLEGLERGERSIDRAEAAARERPANDQEGVSARYDLARELLQRGRYDEALEELVWLWEEIPSRSPAMTGVRGSFMAAEMARLAAAHPPARERFLEMRDRLPEGERDWMVLNRVVGEQDLTLAWFDRVKADPAAASSLERAGFRLQRMLEARGRWSDMAYLYPRPLESVRKSHRTLESMRVAEQQADMPDEMKDTGTRMFRDACGRVFASLLAADREGEALQAAEVILRLDGSEEMRETLVTIAGRAGQPPEEVRALIDGVSATETDAAEVDDVTGRLSTLETRMDEVSDRLEAIERALQTLLDRQPRASGDGS